MPTQLWREEHTIWPAFIVGLALFQDDPGSRIRGVTVSLNGLTITGLRRGRSRFVPWTDVRDVTAAPPPDLAEVTLAGGDVVLLDRHHLPRRADDHLRRDRFDVLHRAFAASGQAPDGDARSSH